MLRIAIAVIIIAHMSATIVQNVSTPSSPSNIPSLEQKAKSLDDKVDFWTRWSFIFVVLTAVTAVLYGVTQGYLANRAKLATKAQKELSAAKEQENTENLARIRGEASAESKRIEGEAKERIAQVESDASQKIAAANRRSDEIQTSANLAAQQLKAQNLKTEAQLEAERNTRVQLEKSLAPRLIPVISINTESTVDRLRPFAGMKFAIVSIDDEESRRAASQIAKALLAAGWTQEGAISRSIEFPDGVTVSHRGYKPDENPEGDRAEAASVMLIAFLLGHEWTQVGENFTWPPDAPPANTIIISVGFKPNQYFAEQWQNAYFKRLRNGKNGPQIERLSDEIRREAVKFRENLSPSMERLEEWLRQRKPPQ